LKLSFFWIGHPAIDWPDYTVFNVAAMRPYFSVPRIAGILVVRVLPLVALLGLIVLHEFHGQIHKVKPLLFICGYFLFVYALTYPEMRYSELVHPLLIIMIATAVKPKVFKVGRRTAIKYQSQWDFT
jgi:hypothetical protein